MDRYFKRGYDKKEPRTNRHLLEPPIRSTLPAVDIPGFFDAVEAALQIHIKSYGTPEGTTPKFEHEFPRERMTKTDDPFDVITFRVVSSSMAPTMNDGSAPRTPEVRQIMPHPKQAGYNLVVYGWWELVIVEFSIWSRSNLRADLLTNWFHRFMVKYATELDYFLARGVQHFRFVARGDDDFDSEQRQEIYRRRLKYEIRLEYLDTLMEKTLQSVDLIIGVAKQTDTIVIPSDPNSDK